MTEKLRILLAEDHRTVREGVKLLVNAQADMEVIGEAGDGEDLLSLALTLVPDVILMDISMPILNGLQATQRIRSQFEKVRILAFTRHMDDGYLRQVISAGANGYVLKQSAPTELIKAIRTVGQGHSYLDPSITEKVMDGYAGTDSLRGEGSSDLSPREVEVLKMISLGYSNKEIGARVRLSVKTIEAHKANAMRKLGITRRTQIVRYAILQNWLQEDD